MVKFDTVDRDTLNCALGRLGRPAWFRKVYFSFHKEVRLRFKLATGLGVSWSRDGGIIPRMSLQHGLYCRTIRSMVPTSGKSEGYFSPTLRVCMVVRDQLSLSTLLVPSGLRWHEQFGPVNSS